MCVLEWRTVSALTKGLFWCLFPELRSNDGNKYQNNTRVSTETVYHESTYVILFLTRHNDYINDDKNDDLYTPSPCLTRSVFVLLLTSQSIVGDVTMTRQLRRDHVNSSQVIKWVFFSTETHDIFYNLYVRFWRVGGQRSIAHRAVHLNIKHKCMNTVNYWYITVECDIILKTARKGRKRNSDI